MTPRGPSRNVNPLMLLVALSGWRKISFQFPLAEVPEGVPRICCALSATERFVAIVVAGAR